MERLPIEIPMDAVKEVCRKYHVKELSLFGSVLRPDFRPDSDVDVLVEFEPDARIGFLAYAGLAEELSEVIGRQVDLVSKNGLKWVIRESVLESSSVIYAN